MKATREQQKVEAIDRMRRLGVIGDAIKQFQHDDMVMVSEQGILYWLDEDQQKMVKEFEDEYGALVFMVIHNHTEFGELLSMLYISRDKDVWEYDREDLKQGYAYAYVKNLDDETCSECGMIGVANRFGGLVRTH